MKKTLSPAHSLRWVLSLLLAALSCLASRPSRALPSPAAQLFVRLDSPSRRLIASTCSDSKLPCKRPAFVLRKVPQDLQLDSFRFERLTLAQGKQVVLVRATGTKRGEWVSVVDTSGPSNKAPDELLHGFLSKRKGGDLAYRRLIWHEAIGNGQQRLLLGKVYPSATLCGRQARLSVRRLDPNAMGWKKTNGRALGDKEKSESVRLFASRQTHNYTTKAPRLLRATVASSAVGGVRSALTDGKLTTRWAEKRPGHGSAEWVSMQSSRNVPITGFEFVVRSTATEADDATNQKAPLQLAPRTFYIADSEHLWHITMPEDAQQLPPGTAYRVELPKPIRSDCIALVLDKAYGSSPGANPQVGLAEFRARTSMDALGPEQLVQQLEKPDAANAAKTLLARSEQAGVQAVIGAFKTLSSTAQLQAFDIIEAGACLTTAPFLVARLLQLSGSKNNALRRRVDAQLRSCRFRSAPLLAQSLGQLQPGTAQVAAGEALSSIAPKLAVAAILSVLDKGSVAIRRKLRQSLGTAARSGRADRVLPQAFTDFAKLSRVSQIDLLRALGKKVVGLSPAAKALDRIGQQDTSFRTRYLLMGPAGILARAGEINARNYLAKHITSDKSPHIRARAAAVAKGVRGLEKSLAAALRDKAPRVREAALNSLDANTQTTKTPQPEVIRLLSKDPWTFVKVAAARALRTAPVDEQSDSALLDALETPSTAVRIAALSALGERNSQTTRAQVLEFAEDPMQPQAVRVSAIGALASMCMHDAAPFLYKLAYRIVQQQLPYDRPLGLAALRALGRIRPLNLKRKLAPLLQKHPRIPRRVRGLTLQALTQRGGCGPQS